ncbi:hypothetical protein CK203_045358 [Vitis vinifera]|uniref:Uncharacterized protein n=1 Tax=Vitis vinifera TaxID=29760 RepID=A0A438H9N1_VITVI|nr:hypothetical protein CK203_045358 [Vitis vinifera]
MWCGVERENVVRGLCCGVEREKVMRKKMRELVLKVRDGRVGGFGIPMEMSMAWLWWAAGYENGCERNEATVWVQRGDGVGFIKVVDLGKSPPANAAGWNYMNAVLENYSLGVTCHGYTKSR